LAETADIYMERTHYNKCPPLK